jgi:hypothetical protein
MQAWEYQKNEGACSGQLWLSHFLDRLAKFQFVFEYFACPIWERKREKKDEFNI